MKNSTVMKSCKRFFAVLLTLVMVLCAVPFSASAAFGKPDFKPYEPKSTITFVFDEDEDVLTGTALFTAANKSDKCEFDVVRRLEKPAYAEMVRYSVKDEKNMFHAYLTSDGTSFEESCFPYIEKWETETDKESGETVHTGVCGVCGETVKVTCLECLQKLPAFRRDAAKITPKNDMKEPCPICGKDVMLIDEDNLHIEKGEAVPVNCKEYGYVLYTFPGFAVSYRAEDRTTDLESLHTWSNPVYFEATCNRPAKYVKTCTFCGKESKLYQGNCNPDNHNVEKWEHFEDSFNDADEHENTCIHYGTCTLCKKIVSEECTFTIQTEKATCTKGESVSYICSGCGYAEIQGEVGHALGHEYENTVHNWPDATHTGTCIRCKGTFTFNVSVKKEKNPEYDKTKPCKATEFIYTCVVCGETWQEEAPGHQLGEYQITKVATCTEKSIQTAECTVCGKKVSEELTVDPNNHVGGTEVRNDAEANYVKDGYTGDVYCLGCGKIVTKGEVIPMLVKIGDVDGNGEVECKDARLALRAAVNMEQLSALREEVGDVDGDGKLTAADSRLILRYFVKLETSFPVEK